eukprot:CAMPEP_0206004822 /NCGR_PEP_ID=MMETSP1464-20131121/4213_1 /ASSEMBLY_ACC=CAM_ASM_001124 /TAXON_ID=119497 /ORGANISM="Exanthemachrysis gayraliae, Strain RCC1523" /LENGTH=103 /DNA_ID=CAMNT_0053378241 /DNA_START=17 /DNA_END=328 /DNA_ORIENTATION=-
MTEQADARPDELPAALGWVMNLLEPGTHPAVFTFFKGVVFLLVLCVASLLLLVDVGADVRIHLKAFLALAVVLLGLTVWFFGELQAARAAAPAAEAAERKKGD